MKLYKRLASAGTVLGLGMALVVIPSGTAQAAGIACNLATTVVSVEAATVRTLIQSQEGALATFHRVTLGAAILTAEQVACANDIASSQTVEDAFTAIDNYFAALTADFNSPVPGVAETLTTNIISSVATIQGV